MAIEIPVFVLRNEDDLIPDAPFVIIVAGNGTFLQKRTGLVESLTPFNAPIPCLAKCTPWAELNVEKIPFELFMKIMHFMRTIFKMHRTECNVILFFQETERRWHAVVPHQRTSSASVHYTDGIQGAHNGWLKVGTIHSHCDFGAGHSHGDHEDEKHFDGIHITLGHVTDETPSLSVSLVIDGIRFKKLPQDYIAGVRLNVTVTEEPTFETQWVENDEVQEPLPEVISITTPFVYLTDYELMNRFFGKARWPTLPPKTPLVTPSRLKKVTVQTGTEEITTTKLVIELPEGMQVESYAFPKDWIPAVTPASKIVYKSYSQGYKGKGRRVIRVRADYRKLSDAELDEEREEDMRYTQAELDELDCVNPSGTQVSDEKTPDLDPSED